MAKYHFVCNKLSIYIVSNMKYKLKTYNFFSKKKNSINQASVSSEKCQVRFGPEMVNSQGIICITELSSLELNNLSDN